MSAGILFHYQMSFVFPECWFYRLGNGLIVTLFISAIVLFFANPTITSMPCLKYVTQYPAGAADSLSLSQCPISVFKSAILGRFLDSGSGWYSTSLQFRPFACVFVSGTRPDYC
jgi:hypothetical protein